MDFAFLPELLAPAGSLPKLRTAFLYGADAAYVGGLSLNLRAGCDGFDKNDLANGLDIARAHSGRVYYCLNSLPREQELADLPAIIEQTADLGVDGFIIADPGVLSLARKYAPEIPVHLSTQANSCNSAAVSFWQNQGVKRVNLARELSCREIHAIRKACPGIELETFVHGAMCLAVSGQCLMSAWLNGRPANSGQCTQPCRFDYRLFPENSESCSPAAYTVEEKLRPGQPLWTASREDGFSAIWAPEDLCLIRYLPWFAMNRIQALKIEGRMKGEGYLCHVVDAYATALRSLTDPAHGPYTAEQFMAELVTTASRPLSSGFFLPVGKRDFRKEYLAATGREKEDRSLISSLAQPLLGQVHEPVGGYSGDHGWLIDVRGSWRAADPVEVMLPGLKRPLLKGGSYRLENLRGEKMETLGSGTRAVLQVQSDDLRPGIFLRRASA